MNGRCVVSLHCWERVQGAIAGLVGVTPACGYIGVGGALIIGVVAGLAGLWGVTMLKRLLRVDDPLRCLRCARRLWHCRLYHDQVLLPARWAAWASLKV